MHVHKNLKLKLKPNGQIRSYQVQIISTRLIKQQLRSLGDIPSRCQHWGSYKKLLSENERNPSMAWWTAILSVCYFNTTQQMVVLGNARMWVRACMPMLVWEAYIYIYHHISLCCGKIYQWETQSYRKLTILIFKKLLYGNGK